MSSIDSDIDIINKRLHISGLSSTTTASDIRDRFKTFGAVKVVEGLGQLNGVGLPKSFGYVEIQGTKAQLTRCMNVLNGSVWKGAKLRIAEAKTDYAQRLTNERSSTPPQGKRRKLRANECSHSTLLPIDTPLTTSVAERSPGWVVTPMGRLVRPIKMRPPRPLPPQQQTVIRSSKKEKEGKEKGKKKNKKLDTRARRRVIDPTKWDSTLLKGMWLEGVTVAADDMKIVDLTLETTANDSTSESEDERDAIDGHYMPSALLEEAGKPSGPSVHQITTADLRDETRSSLAFLSSMFRDEDDNWLGRESIGSDIEMPEDDRQIDAGKAEYDIDFEEVPMAKNYLKQSGDRNNLADDQEGEYKGEEANSKEMEDAKLQSDTQTSKDAKKQTKTLKELFAPRAEQDGFLLFDDLELEFDLDMEVEMGVGQELKEIPSADQPNVPSFMQGIDPVIVPAATIAPISITSIDPNLPLFFPRDPSGPSAHLKRPLDPFSALAAHGWSEFRRTETGEEIKAKWQSMRKDLTEGWKKRSREAVKVGRRRGNVMHDEIGD